MSGIVVYDCEIVNCIAGYRDKKIEGIRYAKGWEDYSGMGISVIGAYDYSEDRYRVFCRDNFHSFQMLVDSKDIVAGFNSRSFDDNLCREHGIIISASKGYDILVEVWKCNGLSEKFHRGTHGGYGLDACARANTNSMGKSMDGAMAPVNWQRGKIGCVIDYCLGDVAMTRDLLDMIILDGGFKSPKTNKFMRIKKPKGF